MSSLCRIASTGDVSRSRRNRPMRAWITRLAELLNLSPAAARQCAVITQTCDVIRPPDVRGFVEFAPVVQLAGHTLSMATQRRTPRYVATPQLGPDWFADLDRVLTVPKRTAASFANLGSLASPELGRRFAAATVGRNYGRAALPDDLGRAASRLRDRFVEKHGNKSAEGSALFALRELRVRAIPGWDASAIRVIVYFIVPTGSHIGLDGETVLDADAWDDWVKKWHALFVPQGTIAAFNSVPITYENGCFDVHELGPARPRVLVTTKRLSPLTAATLVRAGWPAEADPDLLWLKPHVARLRRKVEVAGGPPILAIRGVGYRLGAADARP